MSEYLQEINHLSGDEKSSEKLDVDDKKDVLDMPVSSQTAEEPNSGTTANDDTTQLAPSLDPGRGDVEQNGANKLSGTEDVKIEEIAAEVPTLEEPRCEMDASTINNGAHELGECNPDGGTQTSSSLRHDSEVQTRSKFQAGDSSKERSCALNTDTGSAGMVESQTTRIQLKTEPGGQLGPAEQLPSQSGVELNAGPNIDTTTDGKQGNQTETKGILVATGFCEFDELQPKEKEGPSAAAMPEDNSIFKQDDSMAKQDNTMTKQDNDLTKAVNLNARDIEDSTGARATNTVEMDGLVEESKEHDKNALSAVDSMHTIDTMDTAEAEAMDQDISKVQPAGNDGEPNDSFAKLESSLEDCAGTIQEPKIEQKPDDKPEGETAMSLTTQLRVEILPGDKSPLESKIQIRDDADIGVSDKNVDVKIKPETDDGRLEKRLAPWEQDSQDEIWISVWPGHARVRERPDKGSKKIGDLVNGELVRKIGQKGIWIKHELGWTTIKADKSWLVVPYLGKDNEALNEIFGCKVCARMFLSEDEGQKHRCKYLRQLDNDPASKLPPTSSKPKAGQCRCDSCGKVFPSRASLNSHSWVHGGTKGGTRKKSSVSHMYRCINCGKKFSSREGLRRHSWAEHAFRMSPINNSSTRRKRTRRSRMSSHRESKVVSAPPQSHRATRRSIAQIVPSNLAFSCQECGKKFAKRTSLIGHYQVHGGRSGKRQRSAPRPRKTSKLVNQQDDDGTWPCRMCGRVFASSQSLDGHYWVHGGKSKVLQSAPGEMLPPVKRRRRRRTHTRQKDDPDSESKQIYTCEVCSKTFSSPFALSGHRNAHSAKNKARRSSIEQRDESDEDGKFRCEECPDTFATRSALKSHYTKHGGRHLPAKITKPEKGQRCRVKFEKGFWYLGRVGKVRLVREGKWSIQIRYDDGELEEGTPYPDQDVVLLAEKQRGGSQ